MTDNLSKTQKSNEERKSILENYIFRFLNENPRYEIKNKSDFNAVFVRPAGKVNHILHLLLSVVTFGFWIFIWILLILSNPKEKTQSASVDIFGNTHIS